MNLTLDEISKAVGGKLDAKQKTDQIFEKISIDTRTLKKGEVFWAIKGDHFDGNLFAKDAFKKGASCLVLNNRLSNQKDIQSLFIPKIFVADEIKALGDLASHWRSLFHIPVLAITGSNGKTTTRAISSALISTRFRTHQTQGNLNNLIGLPLTLLDLNRNHEALVVEMGMNRLGEIKRLTEIVRPTLGLITNVAPVHLEYLKTVENVAKAKGELFIEMPKDSLALVNEDDSFCPQLAMEAKIPKEQQVTFGWKKTAQIMVERVRPWYDEVEKDLVRGSIVLIRDRRINKKGDVLELQFPLPGDHNVYNLLAAVTAALALDVNSEQIAKAIRTVQSVGSRSRIVKLSQKRFVLDDCYNANPTSMKMALHSLKALRGKEPALAVLGEMLELGEESDKLHFELGQEAAKSEIEELYAVGEHASEIAKGAEKEGMDPNRIHLIFEKSKGKPPDNLIEELANQLKSRFTSGKWLLLKGSRGMALERVLEHIYRELGIKNGLNEKV